MMMQEERWRTDLSWMMMMMMMMTMPASAGSTNPEKRSALPCNQGTNC